MDYDRDKIEESVLALLGVFEFDQGVSGNAMTSR